MNWKIVFQLSFLGLIMGFGTVSLIPTFLEPVFWVIIFIFSAYIIAKACTRKYFLNGFILALINCVWITAAHVIFCDTYIQHHPYMSPQRLGMPPSLYNHPREVLVIIAPGFALSCAIVLGLLCFISAKIIKKKKTAPTA